MKIVKDNATQKIIKTPKSVRCPRCNSILLVEEGDYKKRYDWGYDNNGEYKKYSYYVIKCPCCEEETNLYDYENI